LSGVEEYFVEICQDNGDSLQCDMIMISELPYQRQVINRLSVLGVIDVADGMLPVNQVDRIAKILRLRHNFGVNLSAATIICDLLDRIGKMEKQIEYLKRP
jgi:hypothetical protein